MPTETKDLDGLRCQVEELVKKLDCMANELGLECETDGVERDSAAGTKTILVVEDNKDSRDILVRVLERAGYATISAASDADAVEKLEQVIPNLILLDVRPTKRDGLKLKLKERLLSNPKLRNVPLVVISASGDVIDLRVASEADAYFEKPVNLTSLLETIPSLVS